MPEVQIVLRPAGLISENALKQGQAIQKEMELVDIHLGCPLFVPRADAGPALPEYLLSSGSQ
ncbi:MAG: hypothetical protein PF508_00100 [Spirochaeta sp.]|nr:hypothetical protein [Spirochaeta sp.]